MKSMFSKFFSFALFLTLFVLAQTVSAMNIPVSWNADPLAAGYKIYYGTASGVYTGTGANEGNSPVDVGNVTSATLTGLDGCSKYYFCVAAYGTDGLEGLKSAEKHTAYITSVYADSNGTLGLGDSALITFEFSDTFKLIGGPLNVVFNTGQVKQIGAMPTFSSTSFTYTVGAGENVSQLEVSDIYLDPNTTTFCVYHDNQPVCPLVPECGLGQNGTLAVDTPDVGQVTGCTAGCP